MKDEKLQEGLLSYMDNLDKRKDKFQTEEYGRHSFPCRECIHKDDDIEYCRECCHYAK